MQHSFYIVILLISATTPANNTRKKCHFRDTVDLTNETRLRNGSYLYHGILIPEDKLDYYNYSLGFRNKVEQAELHLRGCICDEYRQIHCVKMCCERGEMFNGTSVRCEKMPEKLNASTDLAIRLQNGSHKTVNIFEHFVHQVGLPCKHPDILSEEADAWDLLENGTIHIANDYAWTLDTVSYCISPYRHSKSDKHILTPMTCPIKNEVTFSLLLNTYAMAVSVVFIIPTILVYMLVKELRGNLRGKLLICYLVSMAVGYSIISYVNISQTNLRFEVCSALGFTAYFFFMSVHMWLSVLCFDIWNNFQEINFENNTKKERIRFFIYSVYSWGAASLLTVFVVWAQLSDLVDDVYKPGIGIDMCWLDTRKWSAAIYFYWPNCIIIIVNIITFTNLTIRIYTTRRNVSRMTTREKYLQENAFVIMRLFLIMGISWFFDIIAYLFRNYKNVEPMFVLTDFCNVIQGVLIFLLFVLKREVLDLIKAGVGRNTTRNRAHLPPRHQQHLVAAPTTSASRH